MTKAADFLGRSMALASMLWRVASPQRDARPPAQVKDDKAAVDADAPVAVSLVAARELKTPRVVTLSGTLVGAEEADVAAGAAGKVLATFVERGSVVRKGAVLVKLDARSVGAQAAQAAADAEASRVQAAQAKLDCDRTEKMLEKGAISKADYDKQHTACESQQVDRAVGGGAQVADRRGAARHGDPRAVFGHGRRALGQPRRIRAAPTRRSSRWSTSIRCASRSRCRRPTCRWSSRG